MQPARKRRIRLVAALSAAVMLAVALVYTSISASSEAVQPSDLKTAQTGVSYQLTGKVVDGTLRTTRGGRDFRVRDRDGAMSVPVTYTGVVSDAFREGREVIVTVARRARRSSASATR